MALEANDRAASQAAWRAAYTTYLKLGAVYLVGPVAALNQQIDGTASGLEGGVSNPRFTGLHRIEYGLWSGAAPSSLLATERGLEASVRRLHGVVPHVMILPLEYATRAHEILEDAQRDLRRGGRPLERRRPARHPRGTGSDRRGDLDAQAPAGGR